MHPARFARRAPARRFVSGRSAPALLVAAAGALALLTLGGCQCTRLGRIPPQWRHQHEAGFAVVGGEPFQLTAETRTTSDKPVLFTLKSNEPRRYGEKTVYPDFRAYVSPPSPLRAPLEIHVNFSMPMVDVLSGWAYLVGTSPMGKTTRVRAVGTGTKIIIEVDESASPAVHRVYFVGDASSKVEIHVPPDAEPATLTLEKPGTYMEAYEDGMYADKGAYADNPERAKFVARVIGEIRERGVK